MSLFDSASLVVTPNGYKATKLYSVIPTDGTGDMTFARAGNTATRVNASGLVTSVNADIPRLDYTGGGCPKLLLEPQRTNLVLQSNDFSTEFLVNSTIGTNVVNSPDGTANADSLIENSTSGLHAIYNFGVTTYAAQSYTLSVFAKKGGRDWIAIQLYSGVSYVAYFNLNTGTIGTITGNATASITSFNNGWYRCTITGTMTAEIGGYGIYSANANNSNNYSGTNGLASLYLYGRQIEAGSYATSYIPTTTAAVTRNGDSGTTNIASLINANEGVLFLDYQPLNNSDNYPVDLQLQYNGTNSVNGVTIYQNGNIPSIVIRSNSSIIYNLGLTATTANTRNKIAIAYKSNDFAVYQNGLLKGSQNSGNAPLALNEIRLSDGTRHFSINSIAVWKTRLSNADLAALTSL